VSENTLNLLRVGVKLQIDKLKNGIWSKLSSSYRNCCAPIDRTQLLILIVGINGELVISRIFLDFTCTRDGSAAFVIMANDK
jgi:hypothetical protein